MEAINKDEFPSVFRDLIIIAFSRNQNQKSLGTHHLRRINLTGKVAINK